MIMLHGPQPQKSINILKNTWLKIRDLNYFKWNLDYSPILIWSIYCSSSLNLSEIKFANKEHFFRKKDKVTGNKPLARIDSNDIDVGVKDVLLFAKLRNEALRLPHFINYYKNLGVNRFFFVDNNSDDNSREIILDEPSAYLFYTEENFKNN